MHNIAIFYRKIDWINDVGFFQKGVVISIKGQTCEFDDDLKDIWKWGNLTIKKYTVGMAVIGVL